MANRKRPQPPKKPEDKVPAATTDRHSSKKMFRIEDDIHRGFKILADRNDRPMSREVRSALVKHLRDNGLWPVPHAEE